MSTIMKKKAAVSMDIIMNMVMRMMKSVNAAGMSTIIMKKSAAADMSTSMNMIMKKNAAVSMDIIMSTAISMIKSADAMGTNIITMKKSAGVTDITMRKSVNVMAMSTIIMRKNADATAMSMKNHAAAAMIITGMSMDTVENGRWVVPAGMTTDILMDTTMAAAADMSTAADPGRRC